jgi:hypothetical protein
MSKYLILYCIFLSGCASKPDIQSYQLQFIRDAQARKVKLYSRTVIVTYATLPKHRIADCLPATHSTAARMRISEEHWEYFTESEREQIVYHELGHCFLHLAHQRAGIMQANIMPDWEYVKHRKTLINNLFRLTNE